MRRKVEHPGSSSQRHGRAWPASSGCSSWRCSRSSMFPRRSRNGRRRPCRLFDKLGYPIAELARMARSSRYVVVDEQGYAMHLVLVHGPAKLRLRNLEDLGRCREQRPHHGLPVLVDVTGGSVDIEHELENVAHEGRSKGAEVLDLRRKSALLAPVGVLNGLPTDGGAVAVSADLEAMRGALRTQSCPLPAYLFLTNPPGKRISKETASLGQCWLKWTDA